MNVNDFLKLAGEQGKVIILGEDGNAKGVFLPFDEYQKMSGGKSHEEQKEDIAEKVNREILQAQLEEVIAPADGGNVPTASTAERIDSLISKRAQELFNSIPHMDEHAAPINLPSAASLPYNFVAAPEVATTSDEEIRPNFDDI